MRDLLQGRVPRDLDLATTMPPDELLRILPQAWLGPDQSGLAFGSLRLEIDGQALELTTLREESTYSDARKPDAVRFVEDPVQDSLRRDFTVNGMYLDPCSGMLIDPTGGYEDLETGRLRTIGDPCRRFAEDHLRVLRALRFCVQCDLVMDAETWSALCEASALTSSISGTRVLREFEGIFCSRGRARGLMLLVESGVAAALLPSLPPLAGVPQPPQYHPEGDVLGHTALVLAGLPEPVPADLAFAAVFHDTGKLETFEEAEDRIRFHDHDRVSVHIAETWLERHGAARRLVEDVASLIREHIRIAALPGFRAAKRRRFLQERLFDKHLAFHRADCLASHRKLDIYEKMRQEKAQVAPGSLLPLLRGRDLLEIGLSPGPAIGVLLARVEEERAEGRLRSRQDALAFARRWAEGDSGTGGG